MFYTKTQTTRPGACNAAALPSGREPRIPTRDARYQGQGNDQTKPAGSRRLTARNSFGSGKCIFNFKLLTNATRDEDTC